MGTQKLELDKVVAFHEAGHYVAAHRTGIPMSGRVVLSIVPDEGSRGRLIHKMILKEKDLYSINPDRARLKMERIVVTAFAGIEAQRRYNPNSIDYGDKSAAFGNWDGGSDYHEAANLISSFTGSKEEDEAYLDLLRIRAKNLVAANWSFVTAIAEALLEKKTLSATEAKNVIYAATEKAIEFRQTKSS